MNVMNYHFVFYFEWKVFHDREESFFPFTKKKTFLRKSICVCWTQILKEFISRRKLFIYLEFLVLAFVKNDERIQVVIKIIVIRLIELDFRI